MRVLLCALLVKIEVPPPRTHTHTHTHTHTERSFGTHLFAVMLRVFIFLDITSHPCFNALTVVMTNTSHLSLSRRPRHLTARCVWTAHAENLPRQRCLHFKYHYLSRIDWLFAASLHFKYHCLSHVNFIVAASLAGDWPTAAPHASTPRQTCGAYIYIYIYMYILNTLH